MSLTINNNIKTLREKKQEAENALSKKHTELETQKQTFLEKSNRLKNQIDTLEQKQAVIEQERDNLKHNYQKLGKIKDLIIHRKKI